MRLDRPDVIAIGETMILVTPSAAEPVVTATAFQLDAGGAESNLASHLAALGHRVAWVSRLGNDFLGRRILRTLDARGIDTTLVELSDDAPTGVYFKDPGAGIRYYRSGSAASTMGPDVLDRIPLDEVRVVHLSGITPALSPGCAALVDAAVQRVDGSRAVLSFDVNYRPALWGVAEASTALAAIAARAGIVFVGLDEARTLWGTDTPAQVREMLPDPPILVVKDGDVGATEYAGTRETFVPAIPTEVVEEVGAGDAFAGGYLHAYLIGAGSEDRLRAGHERAVLVLGSTGDFLPETETGVAR